MSLMGKEKIELAVRRAEPRDLGALLDLLSQVLEVHAAGRPDLFRSGTRKYSDEEVLEIVADDARPVFVAGPVAAGGGVDEVWGYAFCVLEDYRASQNMQPMLTLYVDDISVDAARRRQGVASALYHHVVAYARELGCHNVTLNVWECNPGARAFYEAMGMRPYKTGMEQVL